jgi:hypothetical protein
MGVRASRSTVTATRVEAIQPVSVPEVNKEYDIDTASSYLRYERLSLVDVDFYATLVSMIGILAALTISQAVEPMGHARDLRRRPPAVGAAATHSERSRLVNEALYSLELPDRLSRQEQACAAAQLARRLAMQVPIQGRSDEIDALISAVEMSEKDACRGTILESANR